MASRILGFLLILLIATAAFAVGPTGREASANGAARLIVKDAEVGPYLLRIGIVPGSPKVGLLHLSILVQDAAGAVAVTDATVLMTATGPKPGGGSVRVQAFSTPQSPQLYEGDIPLDTLGSWTLTVDADSPLGQGTLDVPFQVTESGGFNLLFVIIGAAAVLVVGSLFWSQRQRGRRSNPGARRN